MTPTTPSRFAEVLSVLRASPLALHLARAPVRGSAGRTRPVSMALVGRLPPLAHERTDHDPGLAFGGIYDAYLRMKGFLDLMAQLRGDPGD